MTEHLRRTFSNYSYEYSDGDSSHLIWLDSICTKISCRGFIKLSKSIALDMGEWAEFSNKAPCIVFEKLTASLEEHCSNSKLTCEWSFHTFGMSLNINGLISILAPYASEGLSQIEIFSKTEGIYSSYP